MLAALVCVEESKDGWLSLMQAMRRRGARHIDRSDCHRRHDWILAAVAQLFAATFRQRCLAHNQRNILNAIPKGESTIVEAELVGIWQQRKPTGGRGPIGGLQSQIWQMLSRSGEKRGGEGRQDVGLLRVFPDDAPAHADHQRH